VSTEVIEASVAEPPDAVPRRRRGLLIVVVVLTLAAGAVVVVMAKPLGRDEPAASRTVAGTTLASVRQGRLSAQVFQTGTLSYVGRADGTPYDVVNQLRGIYTWVPRVGDVIKCGQIMYWVNDDPVLLLSGSRPMYRNLSRGDDGWDVRNLNDNLVALGYADRKTVDEDPSHFGWETEQALEELQDKIGVDTTGELAVGDAVVLPSDLRITAATAKLGGNAAPGVPLAQAVTTAREVVVNLDAAQQAQVKVGNPAQITLPDNRTTAGKVSRIGTVANSPQNQGSSGATIPVHITLNNAKDAGSLDQAPVQVQITTAGVGNALIVPVTALVGQGSGYAVEKVDAAGVHTVVPVTLGLFDNAGGLVQVTGDLKPGDQVVVPSR
jgi:hypothetical protein